MPHGNRNNAWHPLLMALGAIALIVVLAHYLLRLRFGSGRLRAFSRSTSRSLVRRRPAAATQARYNDDYVTGQLTEWFGRAPTPAEMTIGRTIFLDEVRVPGAEFHARHVIPYSLMSGLIEQVLRMPDAAQRVALRDLFAACGATALVGIWDEVCARAAGGQYWAQHIGHDRMSRLATALSNCPVHFVSEAPGNLAAGTHVDVTADAVRLLGEPRIRDIIAAAVDVMNVFGLEPRLRAVGNNLHLSYEGATGGQRRYGYDPRRTVDRQSDTVALARQNQRLMLIANSSPQDQVRYLFRYHPVAFFVGVIALAAAFLKLYLEIERRML